MVRYRRTQEAGSQKKDISGVIGFKLRREIKAGHRIAGTHTADNPGFADRLPEGARLPPSRRRAIVRAPLRAACPGAT